MDLEEVLRTTFACREFTDDPVADETLYRVLELARFAPSGGNRQGAHVIVVRDQEVRQKLGEMCNSTLRIYGAQVDAGENPFNSVIPSKVDFVEAVKTPDERFEMFDRWGDLPVVLVVSIDLETVASMDKELDRVGVVTGGSVYPLVWNILLAARSEGLAGVLTTAVIPEEAAARKLLGLPETHAIAAVVPLGVPVKQLTKLSRREVEEFTTVDQFDGPKLMGPS
jgi:nitroreductase